MIIMEAQMENSVLVGYDFCNDRTQIYCYNVRLDEPEPVGTSYNPGDEWIPTAIALKPNGDWVFGQDALDFGKENKDFLLHNFLKDLSEEKLVLPEGMSECGIKDILLQYFRKTLSLTKMLYPNNKIKSMILTSDCFTPYMVELLYEVLNNLGIHKDRLRIRSHEQCYLYYVMSQSKDIWNNETGLFDFSMKGLMYHEFSLERHKLPLMAKVTTQDLSAKISYEMLINNEPGTNYLFENVSGILLNKKILSAMYVTGVEFKDDWLVPVLERIHASRKMRIFVGPNIYARGACYGAFSTFPGGKFEDYIFSTADSVKYSISLKGYNNDCIKEYYFCRCGMPWYDIRESIEILLDGKRKLEFNVYDSDSKQVGCLQMRLPGLLKRPHRMTRLDVRMFFEESSTLIIQAKDMGFGGIYPSSYRIWEETVKI